MRDTTAVMPLLENTLVASLFAWLTYILYQIFFQKSSENFEKTQKIVLRDEVGLKTAARIRTCGIVPLRRTAA